MSVDSMSVETLEATETRVALHRETLLATARVLDDSRCGRVMRITTRPGGETGYLATDGKRLHATRGAVADDATEVMRLPAYVIEAMQGLEKATESRPVYDLVGRDDGATTLRSGGHVIGWQSSEDPATLPLDAIRDVARAELCRPHDWTVPSWKRLKLTKLETTIVLVVAPEGGGPIEVRPFPDAPPDKATREEEKASREARETALREARRSGKALAVNLAFLKDVAKYVGDGASVGIRGERHALAFGSRDRVALLMPINVA